MKKFKLQKGIISSALAISMLLSGCIKTSENSQTSSSSTNTNIDEVQDRNYPKYMIITESANQVKNEDGTISYEIPESLKDLNFILCEDTCYKVNELSENRNSYASLYDLEKAQLIVQDYINALNTEKETIETDNYRIESINPSKFYNDNGEVLYNLPKEYVEVEGKAYRVSRIMQIICNLQVEIQQDGTITYSVPAGYKVDRNKAVKTVYDLVENADETLEIINNYLSENNSVKKLIK